MPIQPRPASLKGRLRISVRGLVLLVLVIGVWIALWCVR
jgi:hypothetical protein